MTGCRSCAERRRMIAEARAKNGIKGVVKALPSVGRHMMQNPPTVKRDDNGRPQQS